MFNQPAISLVTPWCVCAAGRSLTCCAFLAPCNENHLRQADFLPLVEWWAVSRRIASDKKQKYSSFPSHWHLQHRSCPAGEKRLKGIPLTAASRSTITKGGRRSTKTSLYLPFSIFPPLFSSPSFALLVKHQNPCHKNEHSPPSVCICVSHVDSTSACFIIAYTLQDMYYTPKY